MYKRRKNDYQFTLEDEVDYNSIVERTNVVGMIPMNKETSNGSSKKIFYFLNGSSLKFNSWVEAQEYAVNNNLNFDECFKKGRSICLVEIYHLKRGGNRYNSIFI